ncbi:hypothetical protein QZH41_017097 [Actinostola sp. cb2023]|nr:hypothetical protein QZH41_017097 [Actinostola sp. cb2023]
MTGKELNWKWKFCWKFLSPLIILGLIIGSIVNMIQQGQRTYKAWDRDKGQLTTLTYPPWASFLYFFMTFIPVVCLAFPLFKSCFKRFRKAEITRDTFFGCGACKAIYEACQEKLGERSGTYDLTSPKNLIGYENNAIEMNGVHSDDVLESEPPNSDYSHDNEVTSHPGRSGSHSYHNVGMLTDDAQRNVVSGPQIIDVHRTDHIFPDT